jgi:hypothetical protein
MLRKKSVNIKQLCNNFKKKKKRKHITLQVAVIWWAIWLFPGLPKSIPIKNPSKQKIILIRKCHNTKVLIQKKISNYSLLYLIAPSPFLHLLDKKIHSFWLINSFNMLFKHRDSIKILRILPIWVSFKVPDKKYKYIKRRRVQ